MNKKIVILTAILLVSVAAIIGVSFVSCDGASDETFFKEMSINAELTQEGDLIVSEYWNIYVENDNRNVYKTFDFSDCEGQITDISAVDEDHNLALTFDDDFHYTNSDSITSKNYGTVYYDTTGKTKGGELGVIFRPSNGENRCFRINYTIVNFVTLYDDVADFYWKILSEDFELYISEFSLELTLPGGAHSGDGNTLAFYHCENKYAEYTFEGNTVTYTAQKISASTLLEARVLLAPEALNESGIVDKRAESKLSEFTEYEKGLIEDWNEWLDKQQIVFIADIVACVLIYVLSVGGVVAINFFNKQIKGDYPEFVREIPIGWTAGELGKPFYYYDSNLNDSEQRGRIISATILELARRDYLNLIPVGNGYKIDIDCNVGESKLVDLKPYERTLRNLLLAAQNAVGHPFDMDEFESFAKSHYSMVNRELTLFSKKVCDKFNEGGYIGKSGKIVKALPAIGILLAILGGAMFAFSDVFGLTFTPIAAVACGIFIIVGKPEVAKLNQKGEDLYKEIHGLERYMKEFSNLKDYTVPKLVIWEEYLVYATMMGISKQVLRQLKLVYPELKTIEEDDNYDHFRHRGYFYSYVWMSCHMNTHGDFFDIGDGMGRRLSGINDAVVRLAQPRSSSGGGGFGHGGGGVGGGGGGHGGGGGGAR